MNGVWRQAIGNEGSWGLSNYMNNKVAHIEPILQKPISSLVSAGNERNETVSKDQIDAYSSHTPQASILYTSIMCYDSKPELSYVLVLLF